MASRNVSWLSAKHNLIIPHLHVSWTLAWQLPFWKEKSRIAHATQNSKAWRQRVSRRWPCEQEQKVSLSRPIVMQTKFTCFLMLLGTVCNKRRDMLILFFSFDYTCSSRPSLYVVLEWLAEIFHICFIEKQPPKCLGRQWNKPIWFGYAVASEGRRISSSHTKRVILNKNVIFFISGLCDTIWISLIRIYRRSGTISMREILNPKFNLPVLFNM